MIKRVAFLATAAVLGFSLSTIHTAYGSDSDEGKSLYEDKCMICHGQDGKGDGPAALSLNPKPKDFDRPEFWNQKDLDQVITNQVKNGKGAMPAFSLSDKEVKAIIEYMTKAFKK
jgi:mono/diheme cytochrome c family protein